MHIAHNVLDMADYLRPNGIINSEAKFLFMLRCRMLDVRMNYSGHHADTLCPLCDSERDTQEHLLVCTKLATANSVVSATPEYKELFGEILKQKISISRILNEKFSFRKKLIKNEENWRKLPSEVAHVIQKFLFCGLQYLMYVLIWK